MDNLTFCLLMLARLLISGGGRAGVEGNPGIFCSSLFHLKTGKSLGDSDAL